MWLRPFKKCLSFSLSLSLSFVKFIKGCVSWFEWLSWWHVLARQVTVVAGTSLESHNVHYMRQTRCSALTREYTRMLCIIRYAVGNHNLFIELHYYTETCLITRVVWCGGDLWECEPYPFIFLNITSKGSAMNFYLLCVFHLRCCMSCFYTMLDLNQRNCML